MTKGARRYRNKAKKVHGKVYTVQNSAELYPASGASDDYSRSVNVPLSYTIELRDEGAYNFQLPASQIKETFEENWAAFRILVKFAGKI